MIDKLELTSKTPLLESEVLPIVAICNLRKHSGTDLNNKDKIVSVYFDNIQTKNFNGYYLRIDKIMSENHKNSGLYDLKLDFNVHKTYFYKQHGYFYNYGFFTIKDAIETIKEFIKSIGLRVDLLKVELYEIGLNLNMPKDCMFYIDKMQTIKEKPILTNQKHGIRSICTEFSKNVRIYFKTYDKVYQMAKDKADLMPNEPYILRLETVNRRIERMSLTQFISFKQMQKITDRFLADWQSLQFVRSGLIAPKGTCDLHKTYCTEILNVGTLEFINKAKDDFKNGFISERQKRTKLDFVKNKWNVLKPQIRIAKHEEEDVFFELFFHNFNLSIN